MLWVIFAVMKSAGSGKQRGWMRGQALEAREALRVGAPLGESALIGVQASNTSCKYDRLRSAMVSASGV